MRETDFIQNTCIAIINANQGQVITPALVVRQSIQIAKELQASGVQFDAPSVPERKGLLSWIGKL